MSEGGGGVPSSGAAGNYVSVAEMQVFKIGGEYLDLVAYSDEEILEAIQLAEQRIEVVTGDIFYAKETTEFLDGNGLHELFFPPIIRGRAISIDSLEEVDVDRTTVLHDYVENDEFILYDYYARLIHLDRGRARFNLDAPGRFPRGEKNIKIVGVFGLSEVPKAIIRATKLLASEALLPGSTGMSPIDTVQASWPDFTITFRSVSTGGDIALQGTGFAEVDRLLQPYLNMSSLFQVVPDHRTLHSDNEFRD